MQTNEIVGQVRQLARLPEMDGAPIPKRPMLDARAKRSEAAPRAVTESNRNARRFGAGF